MAYTKLRCFPFNVKTNPAYEVSTKGPEDEILLRLKALGDAVQRLQHLLAARVPAENEPGTLNVLMAPEFFFRPESGAYDFPGVDQMGLQQASRIAESAGELPRATRCPARRPWRDAPGFPGDVGNGSRMEARQGAMRSFQEPHRLPEHPTTRHPGFT